MTRRRLVLFAVAAAVCGAPGCGARTGLPVPPVDPCHARADCTTLGPLDPCCASCCEATPAACAVDPTCAPPNGYYTADENVALRAFGLTSHKQRYGIEFFYQPSRYVSALTSMTVTAANGTVVPNPIYAGSQRDPSLVFYAAIVGVPWQLIACQTVGGVPDLINGFKTSAELSLLDSKGNSFWDDIAGDPENYVSPLSPFMVESTNPRSGTDPITGATIAPPLPRRTARAP